MPTDYEVREQEFNDGFRKAKETHPNLTIDEFRRKRWRFEGAKGSGMGEEAKGIIGDLSDANYNLNFSNSDPFQTLNNKMYLEVGTGVENILKFFSIDFIWRVLPTSVPEEHPQHFGIFFGFNLGL